MGFSFTDIGEGTLTDESSGPREEGQHGGWSGQLAVRARRAELPRAEQEISRIRLTSLRDRNRRLEQERDVDDEVVG